VAWKEGLLPYFRRISGIIVSLEVLLAAQWMSIQLPVKILVNAPANLIPLVLFQPVHNHKARDTIL